MSTGLALAELKLYEEANGRLRYVDYLSNFDISSHKHIFSYVIVSEVVTLCCLVHFFIVTASIAQPGKLTVEDIYSRFCALTYAFHNTDGTAPMAEFADVFDPAGDPQKAMVGMMQVRKQLVCR